MASSPRSSLNAPLRSCEPPSVSGSLTLSGHSRSFDVYGGRVLKTNEAIPSRRTVRKALEVLVVAASCGALSATVIAGLNAFFLSEPDDFDPTVLYLILLVVVGGTLVLHVALAPVDEDADADWLLAVAIITGAPALVFTVVMLGFPFLIALERGWIALAFAPILLVVAGPALGVGVTAGYVLRADESNRHRRVISVAVIFTATAVAQLLLLVVTRNGESIFGG